MSASAPPMDLSAALGKFGLSSFRRGQQEVIENVIAGHDCLCVMPTGGGKSLCYQLPSLVRPGLTIVVSPLIALMKDQVDALHKRGMRATLINSSLTPQQQNERLEQVAAGRFSLVYVAPERLRNPRFLEAIRATPIQLLAVDEAHCISEWGHDFRPDYQKLGRFRESLGNVQTIALTATATPRVRADILRSLQLGSARTFITGFARDNLYFGSLQCMSDRDKDRQLHKFLEGRDESGIIYVATRKRCEELVEQLAKEVRLSVGAYHAGLMPEQRKLIQEKFMAGELKAIVATNAFGMGIDKSDLRYVIHYNMPGTLEAYYQEAGRAGRDSLLSQCVLLFSSQDRYIQEFFIENANPPRAVIQAVYEFLLTREEDPIELTAEEIRENLGLTATAEAVNSSLQILGRTGVMERLEIAGGLAMFRLSNRLPSFIDLLPRDANVRRQVLRTVEKAVGDRRDEPVYIHPRWLMNQLEMDRDTMGRHLRELCKLEDFEYVPPFRGRAIHFRRRDVQFDALQIDHEALATRKKADYEKLDQMVAFAKSTACRQRTILEYFGDSSAADCGICDRCQGRVGFPKMPPAKKNGATQATATAGALEKDGIDRSESSIEITNSESLPTGADGHDRKSLEHASASQVGDSAKDLDSTTDSEATQSGLEKPSIRDAIQILQTLLGAIERTHGYLTKTVLSQHFTGVASKAVTGLRLQRLPEFGLLSAWKKSHATGLIEQLLVQQLIQQSEIRMGKLTVSITELGLRCKDSATEIPPTILDHIGRAMGLIVTPPPQRPAPAIKADRNTKDRTPKDQSPKDQSPKDRSPMPIIVPPSAPVASLNAARDPQEKSDPPFEPVERLACDLPVPNVADAAAAKVDQPILHDWQWTLRLVRHGYRLGECALIRGKSPEAILADLSVAMEYEENVPIDQLFDRRTALAIADLQREPTLPTHPPAVLQVFSGLWPFLQQWLRRAK